MAEHFDIAIIGAGPAGTFAAYTAAKEGTRAVVFEEHEKIGEPVHCGECLSELAAKRLGIELPQEAISLQVKGVRLVFPNRLSSFIEERGFTLEKEKFEQFLGRLGAEQGATYKMRHRVSGIARENGGWKIATTQGEYSAKIIIDASGAAAVASKLLKLNPEPAKVVGLQYELAPIESDGFIDFFLWPRLAPNGYLWVIPKSNGRANVGLVTNEQPKIRAYLDAFVQEYGLQDKKKVGKIAFGGYIPASGALPNTYSDGILLCGDAAGFASPVFEGGTSLAMTSGKFAAEVAAEAIAKGDTSKSALAKYERLWRAEFPDYNTLVAGKKRLYGFSEQELNKIAKLIPRNLSSLSLLDRLKVGANILCFAPSLFAKGFVPAMEALGKSRAQYYGW
ncbi:MAG: NAD(P)/FAD-dependent oxidoreductase [Candidatus Micrarchaeota archaeon]|nr:NAD(P)/FAD-dependent oxidoreductase [Candidatus Micrarchaeota archaeon]